MKKMSECEIRFIQQALLNWFKKNQRDLPWREDYEPYKVWISEVMLQQTQVKTVLPYFERWMKALPTIQSIAEAREDQVLKLWEGLGYYSRARNIQKTARQILEKHGGQFPSKYKDILALPGVGKYTACAISSIAFNQDFQVVDGNVIRVFARLFLYTKDTRLPESDKRMWEWASELLPKGEARNFNQALMEFGALQCTPSNPDCSSCPLSAHCQAHLKGVASQLPDTGPAKQMKNIKVALAVIRKDDKIFIQKRPSSGLMAGLWEFPGGKVERGESAPQALHREIGEELGITIKNLKKIKRIRHVYTSFKVDLHCFEAEHAEGRVRLKFASEGKWVKRSELKKYPFPAADVRLISELLS